jgi:hypothetical protein
LTAMGQIEKLACNSASDNCGLHGGVGERNGRGGVGGDRKTAA